MPSPSPEKKPQNPGAAGAPGEPPRAAGSPPPDPSSSTPNFASLGSRERARASNPSGPSFVVTNEFPKIAGYDILSELGRGNMGVIYKARQHKLNRIVALKMILAGKHADETQRRRFETEAEAVARLQHPNIVQVYDIGEHEEQPFLVMEFVDGGSLDRRLRGRMLSPKASAQLIMQLAKAIHAAHDAGIIHRDLKPGNILITSKGVAKITDFGLAKKLDADTSATASGTILGTPSYMAPEQARSNKLPTTSATDVYGLGAILYELLTGRPPFKEETFLDTMLQVVSAMPKPPHELRDGIPPQLEAICMKCLAKDPTERYMTARQLADALANYLTSSSSATGQSGKLLDQPLKLTGSGSNVEIDAADGEDEAIDLAAKPGSSIVYGGDEPSLSALLRKHPLTAFLSGVCLLLVGLALSTAIMASPKGGAFYLVTLPFAIVLAALSPTPLVVLFSVLAAGGSIAGAVALDMPYNLLAPGLLGALLGGLSRLVAWLTDRLPIHCLLGAFAGLLAGFVLMFSLGINVALLSTWGSTVYLIQIVATSAGAILVGCFLAVLLAPKQSL